MGESEVLLSLSFSLQLLEKNYITVFKRNDLSFSWQLEKGVQAQHPSLDMLIVGAGVARLPHQHWPLWAEYNMNLSHNKRGASRPLATSEIKHRECATEAAPCVYVPGATPKFQRTLSPFISYKISSFFLRPSCDGTSCTKVMCNQNMIHVTWDC